MKLKLEDWTSIASLGLSIMFAALLLSFYNFLIGPEGDGPERVVDPGSLILQIIFISAAPCVVLAGFVFGMARGYGSKIAGTMLIAGGAVMIVGMAASLSLLARIPDQYVVGVVGYVPYFFIPAGAGVIAVGALVLAATKRSPLRSNLDDLR